MLGAARVMQSAANCSLRSSERPEAMLFIEDFRDASLEASRFSVGAGGPPQPAAMRSDRKRNGAHRLVAAVVIGLLMGLGSVKGRDESPPAGPLPPAGGLSRGGSGRESGP